MVAMQLHFDLHAIVASMVSWCNLIVTKEWLTGVPYLPLGRSQHYVPGVGNCTRV
jgi:hypothetical protein